MTEGRDETPLHPRPREVLVIGHMTAGNLGDEMMLLGLLDALHDRVDRVVVLRSRPRDWCDPRPEDDRVRYVPRLGLERLRRLRRPVLLCGGTHLHDADAGQPRWRHLLAMVLLAGQLLTNRVAGGHVHLVAIGLGPFSTRSGRSIARLVLRAASTVTVRDEASRRAAREVAGIDAPVIDDLAVACPGLLARRGSPAGCAVVVVPVPDPAVPGATVPSAADVTRLADSLVDAEGGPWTIGVLSLNGVAANLAATSATAAGARVEDLTPAPGPDVLADALDVLAGAGLVVSARFHGVLAAHLLGRPVIAWPYHPKVSDLAAELDVPLWSGGLDLDRAIDAALGRDEAVPGSDPGPVADGPGPGLRRQLDQVVA